MLEIYDIIKIVKVIREKTNEKQVRTLTLRISEGVMEKLDKAAEKHDESRQKLVEAILEQVLNDPHFVLRIKD